MIFNSLVRVYDDQVSEFVEFDRARVVGVNLAQKSLQVASFERNAQFCNHRSQFVNGDNSVPIHVKFFENRLQFVLLLLVVGQSDETLSNFGNDILDDDLHIFD